MVMCGRPAVLGRAAVLHRGGRAGLVPPGRAGWTTRRRVQLPAARHRGCRRARCLQRLPVRARRGERNRQYTSLHYGIYPMGGARWHRGQCTLRAIAKAKQRSQWSVIGWVTKIYYLDVLVLRKAR
jgi:hypothetical protein